MGRVRQWAAGRRPALATTLSVLVVGAVVATVAVVSPGYEAQRLDLDDGTVWVANGSRNAVGRANPDVHQLNAAVRSVGTDLAVVQAGRDVLLVDRTSATVGVVDPASSTVGDTVPLPPDSPDVFLAGDQAVVVEGGTGQLWSRPVAELADFSAESDADLSVGDDAVTSVAPSGAVTAFSAATHEVSSIEPGEFVVRSTSPVPLEGRGPFQVTSVGPHWAVLDVGTGELVVDGEAVPFPSDAGAPRALQEAADGGGSLAVATTEGLVDVPLEGGGAAEVVVDGLAGEPARPVAAGSCTWAAWSGGTSWSRCGASDGDLRQLDGVPAAADLVLQRNGDRVVLNDRTGGRSWAVQQDAAPIDNWGDLLDVDDQEQSDDEQVTDDPPDLDPDQAPPVAVDDALGARPGRASTLSVLLNDHDPNGDPIVVDSVDEIDPAVGRVDLVNDRQQVLLTLADDAAGVVAFGYSVSDGRGGTASATVTVTVRAEGENSPPTQVRRTTSAVSPAGRVTTSVLGDWVDPDGDAFYLTSATGAPGVSYEPSGEVVYQDPGDGTDSVDVALVVSDGQAESRGSLAISVDGDSTLVAESFSVQAYAGRQVTVRPLAYARGGSGVITLNSVPAKTGSTVSPSYDQGTFRFTSDEVRTHNLEYTVTDGDQTATGTVRVDVQAPPDENTPPITTPKTVFVETLSDETLDVVATDIDPGGNVLLVTSTSEVPLSAGVRVEALEQRYLKLTLVAPLEGRSVRFTYTVSNGLASAEGSVTVVEIPRRSQTQPPVATDDQVTVRVGEAVDLDVMANDEQPDGDDLTLVPDLVRDVPDDGGLLFTAATTLRYLAPSTPGNFTAVYSVSGRDGQTDSAQVSISVREPDPATNAPPVPQTVTARVIAGETVRVSIPLGGVDPDGDSVTLLGVGTNPEKGNVTEVGTDFLEYAADAYAGGTDEFSYSVVDGLGARATGKVRVGISARGEGARNPVAVADVVTTRPGGSITVRVLDNDSDPDGGALTVSGVEANDEGTRAELVDGALVEVAPPAAEGSYGLVYTVDNDRGGSTSSFITVVVDADAPLNRPVADDAVLDLGDIAGRDSVDVDVLANVFFADGPPSALGLGIEPGYDGTSRVTADRRVRVDLTDSAQIIPFFVTHPDDPSVRATAFIRVPGFDDALPQLDKRARPLTVVSGQRLTIDLARYVLAAGGKAVRLTTPGSVRATHSDGSDLVVDDTTLAFTSSDLYFGAASVSFEVTDGVTADDPAGRRATLVLPITVTPRDNQPPTFDGTSIDLEPGQSRSLDLVRLTTYPYPDAVDELRWAATASAVPGFSVDVSGRTLTVTAEAGAVKGTTRTLPVAVSDAASAGRGGAVQLTVVASTRPLAQPAADLQAVRRGTTASIDVLANDQATNPFPGQALRVVDIRGLAGGSLPPGVSVTPGADGRTLSVSASASAAPGDTNLQYRVADVTDDPDRYVWGAVTVSVQDVPSAPAAPVRTGAALGGELTLSYAAPQANNSAVTRFRLTGQGSAGGQYARDCGPTTVCTVAGLDPEQTYRFSVVATNAVGDSPASAPSQPYSADFVPAPPTGLVAVPSSAAPGRLDVRWDAVPRPAGGSAVRSYVVEVTGPGASSTVPVQGTTTTLSGLTPGAQYDIRVSARNLAQVSTDADWARSAPLRATAVGPPGGTAPSAVLRADGSIVVSWSAADPQGAPGVRYAVRRVDAGGEVASCSGDGTVVADGAAPGVVDDTAKSGMRYTYVVEADNGVFCSTSVTSVASLPGVASGDVSIENSGADQFDVRVTGLAVAGDSSGVAFQASVDGGASWRAVPASGFVTSRADASVYGRALTVVLRACRDDVCSTETSAPSQSVTPVDTAATVLSCIPGSVPDVRRPVNAGPQVVDVGLVLEFQRSLFPGLWVAAGDGTSSLPSDASAVRVKGTVTLRGSVSRTAEAWVTASCG